MKLNDQQKAQRKEILRTMVENVRKRCPWMTRDQAVENVEHDLKNDPTKLRIINALAASITH